MKRTELADLGEFGLIERLAKNVKTQHKSTIKGIGDDAAVMELNENEYLLTSTDMLLEDIHFDLSYVPLEHLGYKAIVVNVSDIAAMNGIPLQVTVSLALSNRFSVEAIEAIYKGIYKACENYKVDLVGGDTTSSQKGLVISVNVLGKVNKDLITYRKGGKPNDILCISGDLGGAYLGLQVLEQEKQVFLADPDMQPQLEEKQYVVGRQLKPEARMDFVYKLKDLGVVPTTMIDISDGLASEIFHICKQSETGAVIFEDKIPIHQESNEVAKGFQISPVTAALNGGEDYELLFTIEQKDFEKVKKHHSIFPIGYLAKKEQGVLMQNISEQSISLQAQGWQHF